MVELIAGAAVDIAEKTMQNHMMRLSLLVLVGIAQPMVAFSATISGTVTGPDATLLPGIYATAYTLNGSSWDWAGQAQTDGDGNYTIDWLQAGTYRVQFDDWQNYEYFSGVYSNAPNLEVGTDIVVSAETTVTGINALLAKVCTISGTVTGPDETPLLSGIWANAYKWNGSSWDNVNAVPTDENGDYIVGRLPAGTYRVWFDAVFNSDYLSEWYDDVLNLESGTNIVVTGETTGINASLRLASKIRGTVTGPNGTTALPGIRAYAYRTDGSSWNGAGSTDTDGNGAYIIGGLPAGTYRVQFYDGSGDYLPEWYDNALDLGSGTNIVLAAAVTVSGIDASLALASKISGTVTGPDEVTLLPGIYVYAYTWNGSTWAYTRSVCTDGEGDYTIGGLPAGTYRVGFYDWQNGDYLSEWYDHALDLESGTNVLLAAAERVTGIDASLALASKITGTVTGPTGTPPLPGISANAYTWNGWYWGWVQGTQTDGEGNYTIGGLPAGTYRVQFDDGQNGEYRSQAYDDAPNLDSGTNIVVLAATTVMGINASLANMREISGTVTGPAGTILLSGIRVTAYAWNGLLGDVAGTADTDANGRYAIGVLPAGTYRVRFDDRQNGDYLGEWYYDAQDLAFAEDIVVPGETTQIDASLATASKISGTVIGPDERTLLPGIWATAYAWNDSEWIEMGQTQTDIYGYYTIGGLATGTYRVQFDDRLNRNFLTECYDDKTGLDYGDGIFVPAETTVRFIDASLAAWPPEISGKVTGPDGTPPLPDIYAEAYTWNGAWWDWMGGAQTDSDGNYTIGGLSAGTYRVQFTDGLNGEYFSQVYDNALDLDHGTNIVVSGGTTGINASLGRICAISGTVTRLDESTPLQSIWANAFRWNGSSWDNVNAVPTDEYGHYTVGSLPAGTYRVWFDAVFNSDYLSEWHDDAPDLESGTNIVLTGGVTEINASLTAASKISGTVTGPDGAPPLAGIYVYAHTWDGSYWTWASGVQTDALGNYMIGGLIAGTYRVGFYDWNERDYLSEAYDDALTVDDGTNIIVAAEETVLGIDASLALASKISGNVTGPNGAPPLAGISATACKWNGSFWYGVGQRQTDALGHYTISGLIAGTYRVQFYDESGNYLTESYDNVSSLGLGSNIVLLAAETVMGIDASLALASKISGTVTGRDGITRLPDIYVDVYTWNGSSWDFTERTQTDVAGDYIVGRLPAGTHRVQFNDWQNGEYRAETYDDAPTFDLGTNIVVLAGTTVSGINASLAHMREISGTVTGLGGITLLPDIRVTAYARNGSAWELVDADDTDANGRYSIGVLPAGTYRVQFDDWQNGEYLSEWYTDATNLESATDIEVPGDTTNIDASLTRVAPSKTATVFILF